MANIKIIRGYAAPYDSVGTVQGTFEKFAHGAFSKMLVTWRPVDLRWADHSESAPRLASTSRASLSLFVDSFGVGFEARLDMNDLANWTRLQQITRRQDAMAFASVGGLIIKEQRWEQYGSVHCRVITKATIDHIAITDKSAAYQATAVWPDDPLDDAPWKIRDLASRWHQGRSAWDQKRLPRPSARAVTTRSQVAALLSPRQREFADFRRAILAGVQSRRIPSGAIVGHLAFTRAGGFVDPHWKKFQ